MNRLVLIVLFTMTVAPIAYSAEADDDDAPKGEPIAHRVLPIESFAASVKNWSDESMPHYAIITNPVEWDAVFSPAATADDKRPFKPQPAFFERGMLVSISRVSAAPAPGERVLTVDSVTLEGGQAVVAYSFKPPSRPGGAMVKNTVLVALPAHYADSLRILEETDTVDSLAAELELEEAKAAGRFKQQAPER